MKQILCSTLIFFIFSLNAFASRFEFAFIADAGNKTSSATLSMRSMLHYDVKELVMAGDNLYSGMTYTGVWNPWLQNGFKFFATAIGNHNDGYANEVAFFKMPGEFYSRSYSTLARFIVLNSDNKNNVPAQMAFLENELRTASERFIFLVYHHPTYTLSGFHSWGERETFQRALRPLLWKYRPKITALLMGHDHLALAAQFKDLPALLSGAVMEVRSDRPVNNVQDGVRVSTLWYFDNKPHWARFTLDEASEDVLVDFIKATDNTVNCTLHLRTGLPMQLDDNCRSF